MSAASKSPQSTEERFLNAEGEDGWKGEALAVIHEIEPYVTEIAISDQLPCNESGVYLNLKTQEGATYTVEMSSGGFRLCGDLFDSHEEANDTAMYYETPYALLDAISPAYRQSFGAALSDRLQQLLTK